MEERLKDFAYELAKFAEKIIAASFAETGLTIERKPDASPVTVVDREAEAIMRAKINEFFPQHGIIGEEYGPEREDAEYVWVLDPIDGTISFTHACPLFGTLIGLLHRGKPVLGVINQPILKQFLIGDGKTAVMNGKRVSVRTDHSLSEATLLATDLKYIGRYQDEARFNNLIAETGILRVCGGR